jgi:hypothetical protein
MEELERYERANFYLRNDQEKKKSPGSFHLLAFLRTFVSPLS